MNIVAVINTFNRVSELRAALDSIESQLRKPDSVIVVDDGSTDGTQVFMEGFTKRCSLPLRYIRKENSGLYPSRNVGLIAAEGDYIAFLDDDDSWRKDHLHRCEQLASKNSQATVVGGFISSDDGDTLVIPGEKYLNDFDRIREANVSLLCRKAKVPDKPFFAPHLSACMLKLSSAKSVMFDESFRLRGDILMVWKLGALGDVVLEEKVHADTKILPESLSSGIDQDACPKKFSKQRAVASHCQFRVIEQTIAGRPSSLVPDLASEATSELCSASTHYAKSGEFVNGLTLAFKVLAFGPLSRSLPLCAKLMTAAVFYAVRARFQNC
ncbi:glycosyltransferase family A protein [Ectothiorhodospira variabilis]|uniref:glycosyltransferase family A protein n=1 Tax=Ectothiorhodospira variabilis TaxID=505694 RepID=UPI001EFA8CD7|nr:glycosyltransferase family A protein [Ectothiorhodospira variabilis]MCG5497543.1 glycosyltransferase family 2 protein [Ectothiorhodospira variabilis]